MWSNCCWNALRRCFPVSGISMLTKNCIGYILPAVFVMFQFHKSNGRDKKSSGKSLRRSYRGGREAANDWKWLAE